MKTYENTKPFNRKAYSLNHKSPTLNPHKHRSRNHEARKSPTSSKQAPSRPSPKPKMVLVAKHPQGLLLLALAGRLASADFLVTGGAGLVRGCVFQFSG